MESLLFIPFILQGMLMGIDEYFHFKRGLGKWERLGHPLDTLTVMLPLVYIMNFHYSFNRLLLFIGMAVFSCLFITKDEFIHRHECSGVECWLHAVLFVLHPLIFLANGFLWKLHPGTNFFVIQFVFISLFFLYQIVFWSFVWNRQR